MAGGGQQLVVGAFKFNHGDSEWECGLAFRVMLEEGVLFQFFALCVGQKHLRRKYSASNDVP